MINNVLKNNVLNIAVYFTIFGMLFLISMFNLFFSLYMSGQRTEEFLESEV